MRNRTSDSGAPIAKTWGPFTGRQITTIVCVVIVTVLFPVTAHAVVSGTSVFVTDKASGKTAAVDGDRSLQTKLVGGVFVHGSVPGNLAPSAAFQQAEVSVGTTAGPVLTPPAGQELIVTSAHVDWFNGNAATDYVVTLSVGAANTCTGSVSGSVLFWDLPNAQDSRDTAFSPGYIVPAGKSVCVTKSSATPGVFITLFGYLAPAGSAPAPHLTDPAPSAEPRHG